MSGVVRTLLLVLVCSGIAPRIASAQAIVDRDRDGISDALEADLAARFVPQLRPFSVARGCYASELIDPATGNQYLPRLIYRARHPTSFGRAYPDIIVITYQVLYDNDCGHPLFGLGGHTGDNEPMMVFLKYDYQRNDWVYDSLSTTAHWHAVCFSRESRWVSTPFGTNATHPNVYVGHNKNSNHVDTSWGGCFDDPFNPWNDNDRIKLDGYVDLPDPSRLFNVGEQAEGITNELGDVRPDWHTQRVWNDEDSRFFSAGRIRDVMVSMSDADWNIRTRPNNAVPAEWDSERFFTCDYQLSSTSVDVTGEGGTDTLSVSPLYSGASCGWRIASNTSWISAVVTASELPYVGQGTVGAGYGTISYTVSPNPSSSSRVGTITVGPVIVTVTQNGADCAFSASPRSFEHPSFGGSGQVAISAAAPDCAWTASSNASWITVAEPSSGTGSSSFGFSVAANTSSVPRSSTISVAGLTIPVNQAGVGCSMAINPATVTIGRGAATGSVAISASPGDCPWTASSNAPWLAITSASSGTGAATVTYAVAANFMAGDRTGTLAIAGRTFTVTQQGNTAPLVSWTNPTDGAVLTRGSTVQLSATASDADGIARVEFYVNGTLLASDTSAPYSASWTNLPGGHHGLVAKAFDIYGMMATSAIAVGVSNIDAITFSPASPRAGQTVSITVTGADACGALELDFGDGEFITYAISTLPIMRTHIWMTGGQKTVTATGHGNCFGRLTNTINVIGNDGPSVMITAPATGSAFIHPATVTLSVTASDSDGVSRVEYYSNGNPIGTATSSPFSLSWPAPVGTHRIVAKAFDSLNVSNTSNPVDISVRHVGAIAFNPATPVQGQPTAVTISGSSACTAVEIDYGDGAAIVYPISALPTTQSHTWMSAGAFTVRAIGHGTCEGVVSNNVTIAVNPAPSVSMTSPGAGAAFTAPATIALAASASDAHGVSRVDFYNGSSLIGSTSSAPYQQTWSGVGAGTYSLSAVAFDAYGVSAWSSAVTITVSTPQVTGVSVSTPRTQNVAATVTVTGTSPCGAVEINYGDGTAITYPTSTLPVSYSHVWTTGGWKTVTARGQGNCGGYVATNIYVNYAPSIAITTPASGNAYFGPATFSINANASDPDGAVGRVDFYVNGALLGSRYASPFTFEWPGVPNGTYHFVAIATDNAGAQAASATSTVYVVDPGPSRVTSVSVSPASPVAGQAVTITVLGTNPCGAIYLDYGDGTIIYHPVSGVPSYFSYAWSTPGQKTIIAQGMGNCAGQASTVVTVR